MAQVILLAGPSGAGKSRLASELGLPVLQLDDFYKAGDDPTLPRLPSGAVDWDHPESWNAPAALRAVQVLCETGQADVPIYDISANGPVGNRSLNLDGATHFVAEGIFAAELVAAAGDDGLLAEAICVCRSRWVTFVLRLTRDLKEHRKSPPFLLRRGWRLARQEPAMVRALVRRGCTAMTPREAARRIDALVGATR